MLHFAAVCPAARTPQELSLDSITGRHPLCGLLLEPDLTVQDGCLRVPERPGLGIVLNEAKLLELTSPGSPR
jgi:L-alanine-DL-glutamate epimerase-like enolase superfamily enzyme